MQTQAPGSGEALFDAKTLLLGVLFRENCLKQLLGGSRAIYPEGRGEPAGPFPHLRSAQSLGDAPMSLWLLVLVGWGKAWVVAVPAAESYGINDSFIQKSQNNW